MLSIKVTHDNRLVIEDNLTKGIIDLLSSYLPLAKSSREPPFFFIKGKGIRYHGFLTTDKIEFINNLWMYEEKRDSHVLPAPYSFPHLMY